jgi:cytochrome oxidase Cu insertion factor (SCO1/SenC/PrrC family)
MLTKLFLAGLLFASACVALPCGGSFMARAQTRQKTQRKPARYSCPMHPDFTSARPGKCPKCGMTLRPLADEVEADKSSTTDASADKFPARDGADNSLATDAPDAEARAGDATSNAPPRIPNVAVYDQDGNRRNFYDDLVKGKTVAINFIFTTCTTICPPMTATFRRVQQDLAGGASHVELISVSVDPTTDTPERLHDFAAKFKAGPGWTFVTGDKAAIDSLLGALGAAVADKNDHTPMILVGNDAAGYWTRAYGLSPPATLVKVITEVSNHKR